MNIKVWLKSRISDKVLSPLRADLAKLIDKNSTVLEIGCGTGDLLFQVATKIKFGLGIDIDEGMIEFAELRRKERSLSHLKFDRADALTLKPGKFDIATTTLCLHEMDQDVAFSVLGMMVGNSACVLVADYAAANTVSGRVGIEVDEFFSGHYRQFKRYRNAGGIPGYARHIGASIQSESTSRVDGISIWAIRGEYHSEQIPASSGQS